MKKLVFASTALGLVLAAPVYAQDVTVSENNAALLGSAAFDDDNTVAAGDSAAVSDSVNGNDFSTDSSINDSGNLAVADSGNFELSESLNTDASFNTDIDIDAAVAVSELDGTVSGNTVLNLGVLQAAANTIDGGAFAGLSGISQNVQGVGPNSLAQQNVNVQANMTLGGGM